MKYYCKGDDGDVYVITGYKSLDEWWTGNNMGSA
jgi:hypothetical protein